MKRSILVGCLLLAGIGVLPGKAQAVTISLYTMEKTAFTLWGWNIGTHVWASFWNDNDYYNGDFAGTVEMSSTTAVTVCWNSMFGSGSGETWRCEYPSSGNVENNYKYTSTTAYSYSTIGSHDQNFFNSRSEPGTWGYNGVCHTQTNRAWVYGVGLNMWWLDGNWPQAAPYPSQFQTSYSNFGHCGTTLGIPYNCPSNDGGWAGNL